MDRKSVLLTALLMAVPAFTFGADASRPHCDAKHVGQFWPDPKNDPAAVQDLAQRGELQVCSRTSSWRYNWQRLTITIGQLKPEGKKSSSSSSSSSSADSK